MLSHGQINVIEEILKEMVAVERRCFRKMMVDYSAMEDKVSCGKVCGTGRIYQFIRALGQADMLALNVL